MTLSQIRYSRSSSNSPARASESDSEGLSVSPRGSGHPRAEKPASGLPGVLAGGPRGPERGAAQDGSQPRLLSIHEDKSGNPCQETSYERNLVDEATCRGIKALPSRLERYGKAHERALAMRSFLQEIALGCDDLRDRRAIQRRALNLEACGSWLQFRHYHTIDEIRLHAAKFCQQDRLCPLCAIRRGSKLLRPYVEKSMALMMHHPDLRPYHVVHTVKNGPDLGERFRHLRSSLSTLHDRGKWARNRGQAWSEAALAVGSVTSIEVKRGEGTRGGGWHPHAHAVWFCGRQPDQQALSDEWKQLTGDSHNVYVEPFHFAQADLEPTLDNMAADFCEVFKYAVKFSSMDLCDNWHAFEVLFGKRLLAGRGALHGIKVPDDLLDAPLEVADLPFVDLFFRHQQGQYIRC
jgi:hypothetical protein